MDILEFLRRRRASDQQQLDQLERRLLIPYRVGPDGKREDLTEGNKADLRRQIEELDAQIAFFERQGGRANS